MQAKEIIDETIPYLKYEDDGDRALLLMQEGTTKHLPVIQKGKYIGLISEDTIYDDRYRLGEEIGKYVHAAPELAVKPTSHVFEVIKTITDYKLTCVAVVDKDQNYIGAISMESILKAISMYGFVQEPGAIMIIETDIFSYSLAEVCRIIESNDCRVLSASSNFIKETDKIQITVKVNSTNLTSVIASFERYNYDIVDTYQEIEHTDTLKERFDSLMNYLNI